MTPGIDAAKIAEIARKLTKAQDYMVVDRMKF